MDQALHFPVLRPRFRRITNTENGLIPVYEALRAFTDERSLAFVGPGYLHLAGERPIYEICFRDKIYRMMFRKKSHSDEAHYEFIRCISEGMTSDGILLDAPEFIPNSPLALLTEIASLVGVSEREVLNEAYDILRFRVANVAKYPTSFKPDGYHLTSSLLLIDAEKNIQTFYSTPKLVRPELWTLFLAVLDQEKIQPLINYVFSSTCHREMGTAGRDAAISVLKCRVGNQLQPRPTSIGSLFYLVQHPESILKEGRSVGLAKFDNGF